MVEDEVLDILKEFLENPDETINVDFKEKQSLDKKSERKELAKDIACFANAEGGYIVVGVVNKTWEQVGIDHDSFDVKAIQDVARTRINPPATIEVFERTLNNLNYGIIKIEKSTDIHEVDKRVYKRVDDKCPPLQPNEILKLQMEKVKFKVETLSAIFLPEIQGEYKDLAKQLVQSYPKHSLRRQIESRISTQGKEAKYIEEMVYNQFYDRAIEATEFQILPDVNRLPKHIVNAVAMRAFGMIQILRVGMFSEVDEKELDPGSLESQEIHFHLKLNHAKRKNWSEDNMHNMFLEWMEIFRGFNQIPNDRKLFEYIETLDKDAFDTWISNEYGSVRLHTITRLYIEFSQIYRKTMDSSKSHWVVNVGRLFTDSWFDIIRRIKKKE